MGKKRVEQLGERRARAINFSRNACYIKGVKGGKNKHRRVPLPKHARCYLTDQQKRGKAVTNKKDSTEGINVNRKEGQI